MRKFWRLAGHKLLCFIGIHWWETKRDRSGVRCIYCSKDG